MLMSQNCTSENQFLVQIIIFHHGTISFSKQKISLSPFCHYTTKSLTLWVSLWGPHKDTQGHPQGHARTHFSLTNFDSNFFTIIFCEKRGRPRSSKVKQGQGICPWMWRGGVFAWPCLTLLDSSVLPRTSINEICRETNILLWYPHSVHLPK